MFPDLPATTDPQAPYHAETQNQCPGCGQWRAGPCPQCPAPADAYTLLNLERLLCGEGWSLADARAVLGPNPCPRRANPAPLTTALLARAEKAETQAADLTRELTYERQMRAETEKAMLTLADRVKGQQAELAGQEAAGLATLLEVQAYRRRDPATPDRCLYCEEWPSACDCNPKPTAR